MKKIPCLFLREYPNGPAPKGSKNVVTSEVNPEAAWVVAGEGRATVKLDGTCCMVRDGKLYKRREIKGEFGLRNRRDRKLMERLHATGEVKEDSYESMTWCANNLVDMLSERVEASDKEDSDIGCLCDCVEVQYHREATEEDEARSTVRVANLPS